MRYVLDICYHGANFAGWQIQPNAHTVQAELEAALSTFLRQPVRCMGAGRTDAGVHARQLIVHFDYPEMLPPKLREGVNGILSPDVGVNAVYKALNQDFHARFDATHRAYVYQIVRRKSPLYQGLATWVRHDLDLRLLQSGANMLCEYQEFGSFCKAHAANETNFCRIDHAFWEETQEVLYFFIQADRFLRGMVRAIVGTLLKVGQEKWSLEDLRRIIESQDRSQAGPSAPPEGLYLEKVGYKLGIWERVG